MSATLKYECVNSRALSDRHVGEWHALLSATTEFRSPFFRAEYAITVGAVRPVDVCLAWNGQSLAAVFPFERENEFTGRPVGGPLSNFQGVVAAPGTEWEMEPFLRAARLERLHFHHQLASQPQFQAYASTTAGSPFMDVSDGWSAYLAARAAAGVKRFNAFPRELRRLERELGAVTFAPHSTRPEDFAQLLEWKRAQYARTETRGSLQLDWVVQTFHRLLALQSAEFAGLLSCMYAGETLIAAHAGIRSDTELHYWFPAYDPAVARHSPGLFLLLDIGQWAAASGIRTINLGKGESQYKSWFASAAVDVSVGQIVSARAPGLLGRLSERLLGQRNS